MADQRKPTQGNNSRTGSTTNLQTNINNNTDSNNGEFSFSKCGVLNYYDQDSNIFQRWSKRFIGVDAVQGRLYIFSNKKEKGKVSHVIALDSCSIEASTRRKNSFQLSYKNPHLPTTNWVLACSSDDEVNDWISFLKKTIDTVSEKKKNDGSNNNNNNNNNTGASSGSSSSNEKGETKTGPSPNKFERSSADVGRGGDGFGEILPKDLEITDTAVGKGGSGIVKKGVWLGSVEVAVKMINSIPEFVSAEERAGFWNEMKLLSELRHPNIVSMYGFCQKGEYVFLVTEFIKDGDLSWWIDNCKQQLIFEKKILIALSMAKAMIYLEGKGVVHRDLKPQNILVDSWEEGRVKVCDFGLSKILSPNTENTGGLGGTPRYAAPELDSKSHNNKVDVYSFAVVLWEIEHCEIPFREYDSFWKITAAVGAGVRPKIAPTNPFYSIITRCWDPNPDCRPDFNRIYKDLTELKQSVIRTTMGTNNSSPYLTIPGLTGRGTQSQISKNSVPEENVSALFGMQDTITWSIFSSVYSSTFNLKTPKSVDLLKPALNQGGKIHKASWEQFLQWFSPIIPNNYHNSSNAAAFGRPGYTAKQIESIVGVPGFHGFLGADQAKDVLHDKPQGSFLLRFSQSPGCYSLSVAHQGDVTHWRILTSKRSDLEDPVFTIDENCYSSLSDVVLQHRQIPLIAAYLINSGQEKVVLTQEVVKSA